MNRKRIITNQVLQSSPWLTLALLVGLSTALPNRTVANPQAEQRKAEVAQAMANVPYFAGRWVGEDAEVPREAQKLLRPNAILSRSFQRPGGPRVHVLVVHCGDARDMIGHYPPVCYPSVGWVSQPRHEAHALLTIKGQPFPMRQYVYTRLIDGGREIGIRVLNAFILPDGTVTRDIEAIDRQSDRLGLTVQGVAQVQVIAASAVPADEALQAADEILNAMTELLDALRVGRGGEL